MENVTLNAQGTGETPGSEQPARGAHDTGASRCTDGGEPTPHPAHTWRITGRTALHRLRPWPPGPQARPTLFPRRPGGRRGSLGSYHGVRRAPTTPISAELLSECEGLDMGRTTLRRILVNAGLSGPRRRRPPKHRVRRQRMPREGMLIQMDGSVTTGGWARTDLSSRSCSPWTMPQAVWPGTLFCDHEDTSSYFLLMQGLLRRPRHSSRPVHRPARCLQTPFGISARRDDNPVRAGHGGAGDTTDFRTVAPGKGAGGTDGRNLPGPVDHQDWLITELRLAGATTVGQAKAVLQQFLPRFNRRFGVPAQCPEPAFRPLESGVCAWGISWVPSTAGEWRGTTP